MNKFIQREKHFVGLIIQHFLSISQKCFACSAFQQNFTEALIFIIVHLFSACHSQTRIDFIRKTFRLRILRSFVSETPFIIRAEEIFSLTHFHQNTEFYKFYVIPSWSECCSLSFSAYQRIMGKYIFAGSLPKL